MVCRCCGENLRRALGGLIDVELRQDGRRQVAHVFWPIGGRKLDNRVVSERWVNGHQGLQGDTANGVLGLRVNGDLCQFISSSGDFPSAGELDGGDEHRGTIVLSLLLNQIAEF